MIFRCTAAMQISAVTFIRHLQAAAASRAKDQLDIFDAARGGIFALVWDHLAADNSCAMRQNT
jgi:hypothetical protein